MQYQVNISMVHMITKSMKSLSCYPPYWIEHDILDIYVFY